jgi:O-acetylhomoserine (thiol)-lyase
MKKQTQAIHVPFKRRDAYDALSMPVYNAVAYEFDDAQTMSDAFCGRIDAPDYSRVENPTVTNFELRVKALTDASAVVAVNSGMAAISNTMLALTAQDKNVVTSRHLFGNSYSLLTSSLSRFGVTDKAL